MLLHVIAAADCVDFAANAGSRLHVLDGRVQIVDNAAILGIDYFSDAVFFISNH
jgi:hypothetical protein